MAFKSLQKELPTQNGHLWLKNSISTGNSITGIKNNIRIILSFLYSLAAKKTSLEIGTSFCPLTKIQLSSLNIILESRHMYSMIKTNGLIDSPHGLIILGKTPMISIMMVSFGIQINNTLSNTLNHKSQEL